MGFTSCRCVGYRALYYVAELDSWSGSHISRRHLIFTSTLSNDESPVRLAMNQFDARIGGPVEGKIGVIRLFGNFPEHVGKLQK